MNDKSYHSSKLHDVAHFTEVLFSANMTIHFYENNTAIQVVQVFQNEFNAEALKRIHFQTVKTQMKCGISSGSRSTLFAQTKLIFRETNTKYFKTFTYGP